MFAGFAAQGYPLGAYIIQVCFYSSLKNYLGES
jgi:hypothetical protein